MGLFDALKKSLRLQTDIGSRWMGDQFDLLFPEAPAPPLTGKPLLRILIEVDAWAREIAPDVVLLGNIGRLRTVVETWASQVASQQQIARAVWHFRDDGWLQRVTVLLKASEPASWRGFGFIGLQGAFRETGLIKTPVYWDTAKQMWQQALDQWRGSQ